MPQDDAKAMIQSYQMKAARGRLFVRNVDRKVIDLGELRETDGSWRYLIDATGASRSGFSSPEEAMRAIAGSLRFLWLDGQFTAVADDEEMESDPKAWEEAPGIEFELDEFAPGEPVVDATV